MLMIVKEFTFDAAHFLPGYDGPCRNLHGHTYKLQIGVCGRIDENTGMVCDFSFLSKIVKENIIEKWDHTCLNDHMGYPTAENMILKIMSILKENSDTIKKQKVKLCLIRLWETPTSFAEWRAECYS